MELKAAIGFIAVPKAYRLPCTVLIRAFLRRQDLHAHARKPSRKMKTYGCIYAGDEEFIGPKLGNQGNTMRVASSGRASAIVLREPK